MLEYVLCVRLMLSARLTGIKFAISQQNIFDENEFYVRTPTFFFAYNAGIWQFDILSVLFYRIGENKPNF